MKKRRIHIITIIGARPQFIKAATLSVALRKHARETIIHTGQHYDWEMSDQFFQELALPKPKYNLNVGSDSHGQQTGRMLAKIEEVLLTEQPDLILVYGDTNSTLAGALAAAKLQIPVAHVEAGMRSFDRAMPEELNRVLTDHLSSLLFCPSPTAVDNLKREGIRRHVHFVGDNMLDILFRLLPKAKKRSRVLEKLGVTLKQFLLVTIHRAGNTDDWRSLSSLAHALQAIREPVVFPIHPRTKHALNRFRLLPALHRSQYIKLIHPVGYLDMLRLMSSARVILTDSGGVQKEAFSLKVPCVTLRDSTEWTETVDLGWNTLVGTGPRRILRALYGVDQPREHRFVYGHGHASEKIATYLFRFIQDR